MSDDLKHVKRITGGAGTLVIVYGLLRYTETLATIWFMLTWILLSYGLGWLMDMETYERV